MRPIKSIVVDNMKKITLIMVAILLCLSTAVQFFTILKTRRQNALQIFGQVEQILEENSRELEQVRAKYAAMCLNDARTAAYILEYNPEARNDVEELKKIADSVEVDEIHIFNKQGVIVAGTHPEYYGYSFDSGEQMNFFKPLLTDLSLELVQDVMPNTAAGRMVQYSALWSEDREFIVQVGMDPSTVLQVTEKNELSYIFSLLGTGAGYSLYAVNPETGTVEGATVASAVNQNIAEAGFRAEQLESDAAFIARPDQTISYCLSKKIGENYVVWTTPVSGFYSSIFSSELLLLVGLLFSAAILVYAVTSTMNRIVIDQIKWINVKLRSIQDGDLTAKIDVRDSKEFVELSEHINNMVNSLLESSEKLQMTEKIREQKEALERQHEQLAAAVERAESASKAKSEFLFNMSHDLRTPMNAVLGFTDLALENSDPEARTEYLHNIDIASRQLLALIDNILELSKIEKQEIIVAEDLVNADETCRRLHTVLDSDLKKKHLNCTAVLDIQHPYIYMDTTHYSQIFLNIAGNAIKYTPEGGDIAISFRELPGPEPETCLLETVIEDNGIGMSQEFLGQACESFSRERTSTVSGVQGTGLGLAIVKKLVDLLRGTIEIESQQGLGTRVTVRLPHRLGAAPAEQPVMPDAAIFQGRRILMAEDIDINAVIATKLLTAKGCTVERARDGVECVNMLLKADRGYYDLILMDIQMPNMDGYRAAQCIRALEDAEKAAIPILALTANAFKEDRDKAAGAGMNGHIAKPLEPARLFQSMAEVLRKK